MAGTFAQTSSHGRRWVARQQVHLGPRLAEAIGGHRLVAQALARRGFDDLASAAAFLDPSRYQPSPPTELSDMTVAVERIAQAISKGEQILVWGDFDADGQTATAVLVSTLRDLGGLTRYYIPDRADGHGIQAPRLMRFLQDGISLVVTADTGISELEAISASQGQGVDVVVTDHHDLTAGIPPARAVVNPKRLPSDHPLRELPGVGAAYKLAEALYDALGGGKDPKSLLDLVALGIVADVAVLTGDTRYLLQLGIDRLRDTRRVGLLALMRSAHLVPAGLTEEHIGFDIAPRLNALGRMANAQRAVEFLTTDDPLRARVLAAEVEGLNSLRKLATADVLAGAEGMIERDPALLASSVLVLSQPTWPAGVIGIVAGRLAKKYNRPTVLISAPPGELARGSCRSVAGCSIVDALATNADLLFGFGGHPMAAGLTIEPARLPELRRALDRTVRAQCGGPAPPPPLEIDAFISLESANLELARELDRLAPYGARNPPLVLATRGVSATGAGRLFGRNGSHQRVEVEDETGQTRTVVWWGGGDEPIPERGFDLAYIVRTSDYRGNRTVQLEWVDARAAADAPAGLAEPSMPLRIIDHRGTETPLALLQSLRHEQDENTQIWAEGAHRATTKGQDRRELSAGQVLVIWTAPPGPRELELAMGRVRPRTVYLVAVDPGLDQVGAFLRRLAGLVKGLLAAADGGASRATVSWLASATAQQEATVRAGLLWLEAGGHARVDSDGDEIVLGRGSGAATGDPDAIQAALRNRLHETAAYRAYFRRADAELLLA